MQTERKTFASDFRRFFFRGLAVLLPSMLTLWILWQVSVFVFKNVAEPLNSGIRSAVLWVTPRVIAEERLPSWFQISAEELGEYRASLGTKVLRERPEAVLRAEARREQLKAYWRANGYLSLSGLVLAIVAIYLAGVLLGGLIGRRLYTRLERQVARVPGFKQVYPHVKQVVDMVMGDKPLAFKRCVLVEYPRKGIWSVGFVTGTAMRSVMERAGEDCVTVFIPSTPTPFTGFTIAVPRASVVDLGISMDEAIRYLLTGGVLVPEKQAEAWPIPPAPAGLEGSVSAPSARAPAHGEAGGPTA